MKKILLYMTDFYKYYKDISKALEKKGYEVHWIKDRVDRTFFDRVKLRVNCEALADKSFSQLKNNLERVKSTNFSKVIIIFGGKYIRIRHVEYLKQLYSSAEFVYYAWDSLKFFPKIADILPYFDRIYSFDKNDCSKFGMEFLPLFYTFFKENNVNTKYDYCSVMTFSREKVENYDIIKELLPENSNGYQFLYLPYKSTYFFNKIFYRKLFKKYRMKDFNFKPLSREENDNIINESKVVLDCPLKGQNGLTIRTFNALAHKKKLITTNANILDFDFYCDDNILIIDDNTQQIPLSFFKTPFNEKFALSQMYSIDSFVDVLLGLKKFEYNHKIKEENK